VASIALIDLVADGHHLLYLRLFAEALAAAEHEVSVFCTKPEFMGLACPSQHIHCVAVTEQDPVARGAGRWQVRGQAIRRLQFVARFVRERESQMGRRRFDLIFFAYLDQFLGQGLTRWDVERHLGMQFSGLRFHVGHVRSRQPYAWFRIGPLDPDHVLTSRLCRGFAVLDEEIANSLSSRLLGKRVFVFPDVADPQGATSGTGEGTEVGVAAAGRTIVGLLGCLDQRKGIGEFLQLAEVLKDRPFFFVLAGELAWASLGELEREMLTRMEKQPPGNLLHINQWLSAEEFSSLLRACGVLFVAYRGFDGSSNMLTHAANLRVPVLASDYGLIGERVKKYGLGCVVPEGDVSTMASLLDSGQLQGMASQARFARGCREYSELHSEERLKKEMAALVAYCLSGQHASRSCQGKPNYEEASCLRS
jgi:glycosyltransferase involved in cell wall biosynthesis